MALTEAERTLADAVDFDVGVVQVVLRHSRKKLDRLMVADGDGRLSPGPGMSLAVADGDAAEKLMTAVVPELAKLGCRAFWSERIKPDGSKETDEVAVIKAGDRYDPVRLRRTDGGNYDIFTDDIIGRLRLWEAVCRFDVVGVSTSWVALTFQTLPEELCAFAEEVYLFCPDSITQGAGLWRERDHPEKFKAARVLCPNISPAVRSKAEAKVRQVSGAAASLPPDLQAMLGQVAGAAVEEAETGVRLLARELREKKYLFLWWD
jgi:hypothetical protein